MASLPDLQARYQRLRNKYAKRDVRMSQVQSIREGKMSDVAPDIFADSGPWQEPIVANMIDVAARDMAEMLAPMPAFNCNSHSMTSQSAMDRATLRTQIANGYVNHSNLQVQMYSAADKYVTYGMLPFRVEVDYEAKMPLVRALDPVGAYPQYDRFGRIVSYFQRTMILEDDLCAMYPELSGRIKKNNGWHNTRLLEVVFYHDKDVDAAFLTGGDGLFLDIVDNPIGKVMIEVVQRPGATEIPRGQFDDVIFVQLAKSRLAMLALQAAHESVNAPLVVPSDVADIPIGPGATIHTNNPAGVGRVPLEVPQAAFNEQQVLERELQLGARFPEARTGNTDASIVTGKGVQALMDGYDSQVRGHQGVFARAFTNIISTCFQLDETLFGKEQKNLRGVTNGTPYEIKYTPAKDIAGDYTVDVQYGLMAGLDPSRWLVFGLQARAEKLISRDTLRREMPLDLNVDEESRKTDIEDLEDAAKQAIQGYAQAIPALASQGQDPSQIMGVIAAVIDGRKKGRAMADVIAEALKPPEPEQPSPEDMLEDAQEAAAGQTEGGEGLPPGMTPDGRTMGVGPGMQGAVPGTRPDLNQMMAGIGVDGQPNISGAITRQRAV